MRHFGFGLVPSQMQASSLVAPATLTDFQRAAIQNVAASSLQIAAARTDMTVAQTTTRPILQTATGFITSPTGSRTSIQRYPTSDPAAKSYPVSNLQTLVPKQPDVPQPVQPMAPAPSLPGYTPSPGVPQQTVQCLPGYVPHPADPKLCILASQLNQQGTATGNSQLPLIAAAAAAALLLMR